MARLIVMTILACVFVAAAPLPAQPGGSAFTVEESGRGYGSLADAVAAICARHGASRIAVPAGAPAEIPGVELVVDEPPLSARDLDGLDGVLTGCALAIAETGTIVLDGGARSGRRALTLDHGHIVEIN